MFTRACLPLLVPNTAMRRKRTATGLIDTKMSDFDADVIIGRLVLVAEHLKESTWKVKKKSLTLMQLDRTLHLTTSSNT